MSATPFSSPERGPQKWFFDEIKFLSEQQFEQKDAERPQEFASNVSNWLDLYPPRHVLSAEYVYSAWKPEIIRRVLKGLDKNDPYHTDLGKVAKNPVILVLQLKRVKWIILSPYSTSCLKMCG